MVEVVPGQLVVSTAGRDRGTYYIVVEVMEGPFVTVTDGYYRPISRVKKKNLRHLWVYPAVDHEMAKLFRRRGKVTDASIRAALEQLIARCEEGGEEVS